MKPFQQVNAEFRQRLVDAGFTDDEINLGACTAEFKASIGLLSILPDHPMMELPKLALVNAFSRLLTVASRGMNIAPERVVSVSQQVANHALRQADLHAARLMGAANDTGGDDQPRQSAVIVKLDGSSPAKPTDIN